MPTQDEEWAYDGNSTHYINHVSKGGKHEAGQTPIWTKKSELQGDFARFGILLPSGSTLLTDELLSLKRSGMTSAVMLTQLGCSIVTDSKRAVVTFESRYDWFPVKQEWPVSNETSCSVEYKNMKFVNGVWLPMDIEELYPSYSSQGNQVGILKKESHYVKLQPNIAISPVLFQLPFGRDIGEINPETGFTYLESSPQDSERLKEQRQNYKSTPRDVWFVSVMLTAAAIIFVASKIMKPPEENEKSDKHKTSCK